MLIRSLRRSRPLSRRRSPCGAGALHRFGEVFDLRLEAGHSPFAVLVCSTRRLRAVGPAGRGRELSEMLSAKIHEFGRTLKGKEEIIFNERLMSEEPKTLQQLGERFGVSRERVRQLEKRLQGKIKTYLESQVEKSALD